jgi:hypothetical protein
VAEVHEVCGAIHLHTVFSDGSVTMGELAATAAKVGLDYVMVTDHMTLEGRAPGGAARFDQGVLVVVGYEHHDIRGRNHYLVFGTPAVAAAQAHPQHYIDEVKMAGGVGFIAHPFERRRYFRRLPPYPWTEWDVSGFDGIEIWNQMSDWVEKLRTWFSLVRFAYPRRFLAGPPPELLAVWDARNRRQFVAGLGGVDAHTRVLRVGPFRYTVFPLKVELQGIRTHLYLDEPLDRANGESAGAAALSALRDGRGFVSNVRWGDARGSRIYYQTHDGGCVLPGRRSAPVHSPGTLAVQLPHRAQIRLVRNGAVTAARVGRTADFDITSEGVYRIEALRNGRAWIYSNPFPVGAYPL